MTTKNTLATVFEDYEYRPPACPRCRLADGVVRSGARMVGGERVQLHLCKACGGRFANRTLKDTSYPPRHILEAITYFNHGHTLAQTRDMMGRRFKRKIPTTTIHTWVRRYGDELPFTKIRQRYKLDPASVIRTRRLFHPQPYLFKTHMMKLSYRCREIPRLRSYVLSMMDDAKDHIFQSNDVNRCSILARAIACEASQSLVADSMASRMACLGEELASCNAERHEKVEDFILSNDSATVAVEVPVYMTTNELESYGLPSDQILAGHIDIVQVRSGMVHIMDYKPDLDSARNVHAQLALYAAALSIRTGIGLERIRCSYFDRMRHRELTFLRIKRDGKGQHQRTECLPSPAVDQTTTLPTATTKNQKS